MITVMTGDHALYSVHEPHSPDVKFRGFDPHFSNALVS